MNFNLIKKLSKLLTGLFSDYDVIYNKELNEFNVLYDTRSNFDIFLNII